MKYTHAKSSGQGGTLKGSDCVVRPLRHVEGIKSRRNTYSTYIQGQAKETCKGEGLVGDGVKSFTGLHIGGSGQWDDTRS